MRTLSVIIVALLFSSSIFSQIFSGGDRLYVSYLPLGFNNFYSPDEVAEGTIHHKGICANYSSINVQSFRNRFLFTNYGSWFKAAAADFESSTEKQSLSAELYFNIYHLEHRPEKKTYYSRFSLSAGTGFYSDKISTSAIGKSTSSAAGELMLSSSIHIGDRGKIGINSFLATKHKAPLLVRDIPVDNYTSPKVYIAVNNNMPKKYFQCISPFAYASFNEDEIVERRLKFGIYFRSALLKRVPIYFIKYRPVLVFLLPSSVFYEQINKAEGYYGIGWKLSNILDIFRIKDYRFSCYYQVKMRDFNTNASHFFTVALRRKPNNSFRTPMPFYPMF